MEQTYNGKYKALIGFILGLLGFWLFAQTMLNINVEMGKQLSISSSILNLAVAAAALFSGLFVVVAGNLADRFGADRRCSGGLHGARASGSTYAGCGSYLPGAFHSVYHALLAGLGEGLLGGRSPSACDKLVVYGDLGWGWF